MPRPLRLISWNLHGIPFEDDAAQRFARVADYVGALRPQPDLLLFQEVWTERGGRQLADALPGYAPADLPAPDWLAQRPSGLMAMGHKASAWRIDRVVMHEYSQAGPLWRVWEADAFGDKGVQQLRVVSEDVEVEILHTHLQAMYGRPEYAPIAAAQLGEMTALARTLGDDGPILAAGDLNSSIETERYARLLEHWHDLTRDLREACACGTSVRDDDAAGAWIDFVLAYRQPGWRVRGNFDLLANTARDVPYSDHNGFAAQLFFERAPSAAWLIGTALALGAREPLRRRDLLRGGGAALFAALLP